MLFVSVARVSQFIHNLFGVRVSQFIWREVRIEIGIETKKKLKLHRY